MEPRNLKAAYKFYCEKELSGHHSAEADAMATYEILKAQLDRYKGVKIKDKDGQTIEPIVNDVTELSAFSEQHNSADLVGHIIFNDNKQEVFNFGKHKGKPVEQIFAKEPSYYDWMMKSAFPLSTKKVITSIKLRQFNKGSVIL
jgi:DNA polymerase-3 subunit epsilon